MPQHTCRGRRTIFQEWVLHGGGVYPTSMAVSEGTYCVLSLVAHQSLVLICCLYSLVVWENLSWGGTSLKPCKSLTLRQGSVLREHGDSQAVLRATASSSTFHF